MSALIALAARASAAPVTTRDLGSCDDDDGAAPGAPSDDGACWSTGTAGDPSDPEDPSSPLDEADLTAMEAELLERHGLGPASTTGRSAALGSFRFRAPPLRPSRASRLDLALTWRRNLDEHTTGPARRSDEVWLVATWRR